MLRGTMHIPYRKAYLTGMNALSLVTFFAIGELVMMPALALVYLGGPAGVWHEVSLAGSVLFWILLGGFVWVVGDLFQQYAAKYIGIGRGIPLSNTNQLWGLLWGILVFGELAGSGSSVTLRVVSGSLVMALGAGAIALSTAPRAEHRHWREAARYRVAVDYVRARIVGEETDEVRGRTVWDWLIVAAATGVLVALAVVAEAPRLQDGLRLGRPAPGRDARPLGHLRSRAVSRAPVRLIVEPAQRFHRSRSATFTICPAS